jgi:NitT/TauT family transport system substrate-binding protein
MTKTIRFAFALAVLGWFLAGPASALEKIKVAAVGVNDAQLPMFVAIDQGLFANEGIELDVIQFTGGGVAIQAFAGGSVDTCVCASDHVVRLRNRGLDAGILVSLDRFNTGTLLALARAPFNDLPSLKGQTLGVSSQGSFTDNTLRWAIAKAGLNADRDFRIIVAGGGATLRAAIESGQIAAGTAPTPDLLEFARDAPGKFRTLIDWRSIPHSGQGFIVRERWVAARPELAAGLQRAIVKAQQLIAADPAVARRGARLMFPNRDDAFAAALAAATVPRLSRDGSVSAEGYRNMLDILLLIEPTLRPVPLADVDLQAKLVN